MGKILLAASSALLIASGMSFQIFEGDSKTVPIVLLVLAVLGALLGWYLNRQEMSRMLKSRETKVGAYNVILTLFVIASIVVVNMMARMAPWKKDLTHNKINTLSEQSIKIMQDLAQDIVATAFVNTTSDEKQKAEDLFALYKGHTTKLSVNYYDPNKSPEIARAYQVKAYNSVVLEIPGPKDEQGNPTAKRKVTVEEISEEKITAGFIRLLQETLPLVYFTTGHGEAPLTGTDRAGISAFTEQLPNTGIESKELNLVTSGGIPADAKVVALVNPQKQFLPVEIEALRSFLKKGGSVVAFVEGTQTTREFTDLLKEFGVVVGDNIVIDPTSRLLGASPAMPIIQDFSLTHAISRDFKGGAILGLSSSVKPEDKMPEGLRGEIIAKTTAAAWAENSYKKPPFKKDNSDTPGPVPVVVAVEGKLAGMEKPLRLVVAGDSTFVTNELSRGAGNQDFASNILSWSAGVEGTISIRPKEPGVESFNWNARLGLLMQWFYVVILPLAIIVSGVVIWVRRRRL